MKKCIYTIVLLSTIMLLTACSKGKGAGDYYDDGVTALENGKYEDACKNFENAIALKNDKAIYYIEYGQALTKLGKYEDAINQYSKAIVNVDSSVTNKNRKKAMRGQGVAYYYLGEYEKAIANFKETLDMTCEEDLNTDIRSFLAQCYVKQEKYQEALGVYNALVKEEGTAAIYAQRADVNAHLGDVKAAKQDYDKAISMDAGNYNYYIMEYKMLVAAENEDGAKEVLEQAAAIEAKTDADKYALAQVLYYQQDYDGALALLQKLVETNNEAYRFSGDIYLLKEDYETAIKNYLQYLESGVQGISSTCYYNLSTCYIKLQNYEEASAYVTKGFSAADKNSLQGLQYNEILLCEQNGDFNTAYEKAKAYVKAYPKDKKMKRELNFLATRYKK